MAIRHLSVTEAYELQQQGACYVDVRSTREYADGHPADARNVPLLEHDEDTGQLAPNPDFPRVMRAAFEPDTPLLVGCLVGGRSSRAALMLDAMGFTNVANVRGGFAGARDQTGRLVDPGWVDAGLPVEDGEPPGRRYADLAARADGAP